MSHIME